MIPVKDPSKVKLENWGKLCIPWFVRVRDGVNYAYLGM